MIIDFHVHTFPKSIGARALETLSKNGHVAYFSEASAESLAKSMANAGVSRSVAQPVATRPEQTEKINEGVIRQRDALSRQGILSFGGMHPAFPGYRAEIAKLKSEGIKGIKLHPAFQGTHINDIAYKRIIGAASEAGLAVLVHCGLDVGFLGQNYAPVPELLEVIHEVRPEKLVLAHMGGWQAWDEVERDLAGAPVWLDTAYSLGPVYARAGEETLLPYKENLNGADFARLARKHGTNRILFATDSPWAEPEEYIRFIRRAPLTEEEQAHILYKNALELLG